MFANERSLPRLYEENVPRKTIVLLVPWMLFGTLWLRLNAGLDQATVEFYFSLLTAGALSLLFLAVMDPGIKRELAKLKLLPFVMYFGIFMAGVVVLFAVASLLSAGTIDAQQSESAIFATFLVTTILVVAPIETLVFQWILPKISTMSLKSVDVPTKKRVLGLAVFGGVLSQLTFAGFHYLAYNHDLASMGVAFVIGLGFYGLVKSSPVWGLGAAMGAHAGWNIAVSVLSVGSLGAIFGGIL